MPYTDKQASVPKLQLDPAVRFKPVGPGKWLVWKEGASTYLKTNLSGYLFLRLLRSNRSLHQVAPALNAELGTRLEEEDVLRIYDSRFRNKGLFLDEPPPAPEGTIPPYLLWGFTLLDRQRVAAASRLFSFLHAWPAVLMVVLWLTVSLWMSHPVQLDPEELNWPAELLITACSVLLHEFGHASALLYYGGRPGIIGGGLYLVFPVMFSDVTDAWRLSPRKRVHVNLAGIYFEWAFCAALLTASELWGFGSGKLAAVLILLRSLWNLNPLVRGDGYWVLTDLTGVDRLNERARVELARRLKNPRIWLHPGNSRLLALLGLLHYLAVSLFLVGLLYAVYQSYDSGVMTLLLQAAIHPGDTENTIASLLPRLYPFALLSIVLIRYLMRANEIYSPGHYFRRVVGFPGSRSASTKE